jgi:MarR family transcriptional regulator, organic hydroperoxide resistance regulator
LTQAYRPTLAQFDLTYPQYLVLMVLWEEDDVTLRTIGQRLLLDSGTLSPLLKRLQKSNLIERQRSSEDERELRVVLTDKGRLLRNEMAGAIGRLACSIGLAQDESEAIRTEVLRVRALVSRPTPVAADSPIRV